MAASNFRSLSRPRYQSDSHTTIGNRKASPLRTTHTRSCAGELRIFQVIPDLVQRLDWRAPADILHTRWRLSREDGKELCIGTILEPSDFLPTAVWLQLLNDATNRRRTIFYICWFMATKILELDPKTIFLAKKLTKTNLYPEYSNEVILNRFHSLKFFLKKLKLWAVSKNSTFPTLLSILPAFTCENVCVKCQVCCHFCCCCFRCKQMIRKGSAPRLFREYLC